MKKLRAELAAKIKVNKAEMSKNVEIARITAKMTILDNPAMTQARVKALIVRETSDKLKALDATCTEIVASMPIHNAKTKEDRKWNPSRQYGLGNNIQLLTGVLSGIQYSAVAHKEQMLALTGLDEDLIEQVLEAFGSTAYYSKNYNVVVDESTYDLEELTGALALVAEALDIQLDTSRLTDKVMDSRFEVARVKADLALAQAEITAVVGNNKIILN